MVDMCLLLPMLSKQPRREWVMYKQKVGDLRPHHFDVGVCVSRQAPFLFFLGMKRKSRKKCVQNYCLYLRLCMGPYHRPYHRSAYKLVPLGKLGRV
jgi:hypothetical protein